jgi:Chromo (CHRromatin Organisation MOdifier) domain
VITSNWNIERSVAEGSGIDNSPISEGNFSSIKLAEEWTSVALDIGDLETKQQRRDTFDAPANLNHKLLDPAPPDSSAASGNKYPQSRCIDSNLEKFVTEPQEDGCPPPASVQEIQDIDPPVAVDPDDRQFLVERLVRKRVRGKRVQYLVKWQGYPENENTWEDEKDIHYDLIEIFIAQERFKDSERQYLAPIRSR